MIALAASYLREVNSAPSLSLSIARPLEVASWQAELRGAYTTLDALIADGYGLPEGHAAMQRAGPLQAMRIPRAYAARFDRSDLARCPLYRQAVPWAAEADPEVLPAWAQRCSRALYNSDAPWRADPIGDVSKLAAPRLTHRYVHRALLHVTSACALVCRYCFRKNEITSRTGALYDGSLAPAFAYLQQHEEVQEVIVTGGDPLTLPDEAWRRLLERVDAVGHLRVLRVHSRLPATLPSRLTPNLIALWARARVQVVFAAHVNHPAELTPEAMQAFARLRRAGIPLLHQAVLLAGINDDVEVLAPLLMVLYRAGVRPFSLHHPDYARNTWGFRLGIARGRRLMQRLLGRVSGPALPRYTLDLPGGHGKVDLMSFAVQQVASFSGAKGDDDDDQVAGAVWKIDLPATRECLNQEENNETTHQGLATRLGPARSLRYLDLWPQRDAATQ